MSVRRQTATVTATARVIQNLAEQNHVTYHATDSDRLAHHMTRLAGDVVELRAGPGNLHRTISGVSA